ncbi:hypothetical protein NLX66_003440 [Acinetobacter baumannii]|nr:hypothetical protein [Acinetobacter baumannii]
MSEEYLKERLYWALRSSKTKKNNSIGTMPCIWLVQVPHMDISFVLILGWIQKVQILLKRKVRRGEMLLTTDEVELIKTCHACPEQYDAFFKGSKLDISD